MMKRLPQRLGYAFLSLALIAAALLAMQQPANAGGSSPYSINVREENETDHAVYFTVWTSNGNGEWNRAGGNCLSPARGVIFYAQHYSWKNMDNQNPRVSVWAEIKEKNDNCNGSPTIRHLIKEVRVSNDERDFVVTVRGSGSNFSLQLVRGT